MRDIVIIGAGGFGKEVAWLVNRINQKQPTWNMLGFIDDTIEKQGNLYNGHKVIGTTRWLQVNRKNIWAVCAVGASNARKSIINRLQGIKYATLIDPTVQLSEHVKMGEGCIICSGSILTVDISLGNHVIINLSCTVGHDAVLHNFVTLYPTVNISGNCNIEDCVEFGTGSHIIQGLTVGAGTIVGAGSVVVKSLPEHCTAVGIPAKAIKFHNII